MWRLLLLCGLGLAACAEFPEVDAALAAGEASAEYPALLPFEQLLDAEEPRLTEEDDDVLLARAAALRGRADALRRPVIDRNTRFRMDRGVTQP